MGEVVTGVVVTTVGVEVVVVTGVGESIRGWGVTVGGVITAEIECVSTGVARTRDGGGVESTSTGTGYMTSEYEDSFAGEAFTGIVGVVTGEVS